MPPKGKTKQGAAAHIRGMSEHDYTPIEPSGTGPMGSGVLCDAHGNPVIFNFTAQDARIVARLQDVEDHPDLLLPAAA